MRYEFFLDARDYLKYSLLEDLIRAPEIERLCLVWLLTPDLGQGHGRRRPRLDSARTQLNAFFGRNPLPQLCDVKAYFENLGVGCLSYGGGPDDLITAGRRTDYFARVPNHTLSRSIVFLDPDNGVEPNSGYTTAHVRLDELSSLWRRMDGSSVLVVYQHKPRVSAEQFWPSVSRRVGEALGTSVGFVAGGDVGFLIASRKGSPEAFLDQVRIPNVRVRVGWMLAGGGRSNDLQSRVGHLPLALTGNDRHDGDPGP